MHSVQLYYSTLLHKDRPLIASRMNNGNHEKVFPQVHETALGGPTLHNEKRIVYFSSGEILELKDPEEDDAEEQLSNETLFKEPGGRTKRSFKNVAILVGRMSLLACDFLGERLAGALGLNTAKYQYAIDQYHREHKVTSDDPKDKAENIYLSPRLGGSHYGAIADINSHPGSHGCPNSSYQGDEDSWIQN